ncbi:hypothetical protein KFE25_012203 [Diacronema lutheri]|uniref:Uncharacterized protein n=1 Tax=Diacronema lutheri TaxID=2081491 RepID=A0A8J6CCD2_DIALT|nr:hypothetical protein KFE25_012203 [Diacronema lutheri]
MVSTPAQSFEERARANASRFSELVDEDEGPSPHMLRSTAVPPVELELWAPLPRAPAHRAPALTPQLTTPVVDERDDDPFPENLVEHFHMLPINNSHMRVGVTSSAKKRALKHGDGFPDDLEEYYRTPAKKARRASLFVTE